MEENIEEVSIERDYSNGIVPAKFLKEFPEKLNGKLTEDEFNNIIRKINDLLEEAEETGCHTFAEGLLGCMTLFSIFLCMEGRYGKKINELEKYIEKQNKEVLNQKGITLLNPFYNGLQQIEFVIQNK